ncbi:MAG: hypothetical protein KDC46_09360 [Thermoleophilia bacterium]|nr:hypothetical protein [Thermoleophilia bacterium]
MDPWSDVGLSLSADSRDRHGYVLNNPISFVDTNGHSCSSGTGTVGGSECADAINNYCKKHAGSERCPKGQSQASGSQMEANDHRVIAATGGNSNYVSNPNDHTVAASTVISTKPVRIASLAFVDTDLGVRGHQIPYGCVTAGTDAGCRVAITGDAVDELANGSSDPFARDTRINRWTNNASESLSQACAAGGKGICRGVTYLAFGAAFSDIDLYLEQRNHHGMYKHSRPRVCRATAGVDHGTQRAQTIPTELGK